MNPLFDFTKEYGPGLCGEEHEDVPGMLQHASDVGKGVNGLGRRTTRATIRVTKVQVRDVGGQVDATIGREDHQTERETNGKGQDTKVHQIEREGAIERMTPIE